MIYSIGPCCPQSTVAKTAYLIEAPLLKEDLEHKYQRLHGRQGVHEIAHKASCNRPIRHIKADVKVDVALCLYKLDDGHLGIGHYLQTCYTMCMYASVIAIDLMVILSHNVMVDHK